MDFQGPLTCTDRCSKRDFLFFLIPRDLVSQPQRQLLHLKRELLRTHHEAGLLIFKDVDEAESAVVTLRVCWDLLLFI